MSDDSVWDGIVHMGEDVVDEVGKDLMGIGEVETVIHAGHAIADVAEAGYHAVTGDTDQAGHDLRNAAAEGFEAVPFHDAAWDGMMTLGRAIDGPGNHDVMWNEGGDNAFRDAIGADPEPPAGPPLWENPDEHIEA